MHLRAALGIDVLSTFRVLFAQLAAACAAAADDIAADIHGRSVRIYYRTCLLIVWNSKSASMAGVCNVLVWHKSSIPARLRGLLSESSRGIVMQDARRLVFEPSWGLLEYETAGTLHAGLKAYWVKYARESATHANPRDIYLPIPEVAALAHNASGSNNETITYSLSTKGFMHLMRYSWYPYCPQP